MAPRRLILLSIAGGLCAMLAPALVVQAPALAQSPPSALQRGFTTAVSERLVAAYVVRFGASAGKLLQGWKGYAAQRKRTGAAEADLLAEVNRTLNRIRFIDDATHWGEEDYWATPAESVASN